MLRGSVLICQVFFAEHMVRRTSQTLRQHLHRLPIAVSWSQGSYDVQPHSNFAENATIAAIHTKRRAAGRCLIAAIFTLHLPYE